MATKQDSTTAVEDIGPQRDDFTAKANGPVSTLSAREWERIKEVPQSVRNVGNLFHMSAKAVVEGEKRETKPIAWSKELWGALNCEELLPKVARAKGQAKKADKIRMENLERSSAAEREKAGTVKCPQWEIFQGKAESYVFALLVWAKRRKTSAIDRLVSLKRCMEWIESRIHDEGRAPQAVLSQLSDVYQQYLPSVVELAKLVEENEELLSFPTFRVPSDMQLYPEQKECMECVLEALQKDLVLFAQYQTPPSGGKTSAAALLGACLDHYSKQFPKHETYVVYTCYSSIVRIDVCKHLIAASVPFAIVNNGVVQPSSLCHHKNTPSQTALPPSGWKDRFAYAGRVLRACDRRPCVLVCDIASAEMFLSHRDSDILLFDEPTADIGEQIKQAMRSILALLPRKTVFMSATMPEEGELDAIKKTVENRHGPLILRSLFARRIGMSVTARDGEGRIWCPHHFGHSVDEIESDVHLLRFYSPAVLNELLKNHPDCAHCIDSASLLSYDGIRQSCMNILRSGGGSPKPGLESWKEPRVESFCTTYAHRLPGVTMILTSSADDFYKASMTPLLTEVPTIRRLLKTKKSRQANLSGAEDIDDSKGSLSWPGSVVVNSKEHVERYGGHLDNRFLRLQPVVPTSVVEESAVPLAEAALCGVLLMGSASSDSLFDLTAQALAEEARGTFVCSGKEMIYGVNLPVDRVLVDLDVQTYDDMKQLCGRAGRTGRAARAEIIFCRIDSLKLAMRSDDARFTVLDQVVNAQTQIAFDRQDDGPEELVESTSHEFEQGSEELEKDDEGMSKMPSQIQIGQGILESALSCDENAKTTARIGRSGRSSAASKEIWNLKKVASKWLRQVQASKITVAEMVQQIKESRAAQRLRDLHGDDFREAEFIENVLAVARRGVSA